MPCWQAGPRGSFPPRCSRRCLPKLPAPVRAPTNLIPLALRNPDTARSCPFPSPLLLGRLPHERRLHCGSAFAVQVLQHMHMRFSEAHRVVPYGLLATCLLHFLHQHDTGPRKQYCVSPYICGIVARNCNKVAQVARQSRSTAGVISEVLLPCRRVTQSGGGGH